MNEESSTPHVDWEYVLMGLDGPWDGGFRKRVDYPPVGKWHIEFMGRTRENELLLAHYDPPDDEDAREWFQAFESGSSLLVPVSIDTYFGPTDEPEDDPDEAEDDSAHPGADIVDVGHGWAKQHKTEVIITIPPTVFRDAAVSILLSLRSPGDLLEHRIFRIFAAIDPDNYERFLSTVENIGDFPPPDSNWTTRHRRKATFTQHELTYKQMISVLKQQDGVVSFRQLYRYIDVQDRTARRWLLKSELVDATQKSLHGACFTSDALCTKFLPWLRKNIGCEGARQFIHDLIRAGVVSL